MSKEITISAEVYKELCDKEEFLACIIDTIEDHSDASNWKWILQRARSKYAESFGEEYVH